MYDDDCFYYFKKNFQGGVYLAGFEFFVLCYIYMYISIHLFNKKKWKFIKPTDRHREADNTLVVTNLVLPRGGGLGSRPKNMYGERLGDGVEYHLMKPTPRR